MQQGQATEKISVCTTQQHVFVVYK